jgi:hypothetical protein
MIGVFQRTVPSAMFSATMPCSSVTSWLEAGHRPESSVQAVAK